MGRLIDPACHTTHDNPALRDTCRCNRSCSCKTVSARLARANNSNRGEAQHRRITLKPEWSTSILIGAQAESDLAAFWN
jgi:hypothetical protein